MRDSTIGRAVKQGTRTQRVTDPTTRRPRKPKEPDLTPEQLQQALLDARNQRIQDDLLDYARRQQ